MAVFKPTNKDPKTGERVQGAIWWYKFGFAGRVIRESAKTTKKTIAVEAERKRRAEIEAAYNGVASSRDARSLTLTKALDDYLKDYRLAHRPKSILAAERSVKTLKRYLGNRLLIDLSERDVRDFMLTRKSEGKAARTINYEVGDLSRAIAHARGTRQTWKDFWPNTRKMEERHDVGQALTGDDERRLLDSIPKVKNAPLLGTFIRLLLQTGMRAGEAGALRWCDIDFDRNQLVVGRSKTAAGCREIPLNEELRALLDFHCDWTAEKFGTIEPGWYLFPHGTPQPNDPTRPRGQWQSSWERLREEAKVTIRLHDLRHTVATKYAEAGVPESTMLALMGHMSRRMLERYSHVRMAAKRNAVDALMSSDYKRRKFGEGRESGRVSLTAPTSTPANL